MDLALERERGVGDGKFEPRSDDRGYQNQQTSTPLPGDEKTPSVQVFYSRLVTQWLLSIFQVQNVLYGQRIHWARSARTAISSAELLKVALKTS
jgi:hypothetical protein